LLREFEIDVAIEQHIQVFTKISRANVFVANIHIRDAALIEDVADPADGVGVRPRHPNADSRNSGGVMRNVRKPAVLPKSRPSSVATE